MRYETLLFTRNQRQDFTAFIRPALLTNKDVSAIGGIFNYVTDISRLTAAFPSLYFFPLGEYLLLLRHYNSGRTHAGRGIGVIEGIAVKAQASGDLARALPDFLEHQADLLNVVGSVEDVEALEVAPSTEHTWTGNKPVCDQEPFVASFLARRQADRLFLPFTSDGRARLIRVVCDQRFSAPTFFAFGTNSDVLAQLEKQKAVDVVSFFKTEEMSFRSRKTNRVTERILAESRDAEDTMSLRTPTANEMTLRAQPRHAYSDNHDDTEETMVGASAISIRAFREEPSLAAPMSSEDEDISGDTQEVPLVAPMSEAEKNDLDTTDELPLAAPMSEADQEDLDAPVERTADGEPAVLTMRELRDRIRAEEAAAKPPEADEARRPRDPIHWLLDLVSSIISPSKPK